MRTGPTNEELKELIIELKKVAYTNQSKLWKRIATDLEKPSRQRRAVNLSKINNYTKPGESVIIPGKVLSSGNLDHSLTIIAWRFSEQAKEKIKQANCKALTIKELVKKDLLGKKVRIIG